MLKVTVYRVKLYNVATDASLISRRWATRKGADRMHGEIIEDTATEIDAAQPLMTEVSETKASLAAIQKRLDDDAAERRAANERSKFEAEWDKQRASLRKAGWTDEGIAQVEEHAQKEGIPNLRAAAADWEKLHPPGEPVKPNGFGSWSFLGAENGSESESFVKELIESRGEASGATRKEALRAMQEVREAYRR